MIDLQPVCGLPLNFDEDTEKFRYGEGILFDSVNRIPLSSMLPGLLNKALRYPETVYLEHKNIRHQQDDQFLKDTGYKFDVLMLPSGLMGVEFIRSHIFYSEPMETCSQVSEIVECQSGMLTVLLQKNAPKGEWDFETRVKEGLVVKLRQGEKFTIPKGYYYTFINTRIRPTVFSRFYKEGCLCDYSRFKREQGLAYFAIRKNAKQEIVLNPRYRDIPQIKKISPDGFEIIAPTEFSPDPLYVQVRNQFEAINSLFASSSR